MLPEQVVSPDRRGRKVVVFGDASSRRLVTEAARRADLIIHQAAHVPEKEHSQVHTPSSMAAAL